MSPGLVRVAVWLGCLQALSAFAGEIIILQPTEGQTRTERGSERAMDKARQQSGKVKKSTTIILDEDAVETGADRAEESARDASDHARPTGSMSAEGGTIILRSAPVSDSDRARQRARSYIVPPPAPVARTKDCSGDVSSQVGTIGEGPGATRGNVVERGTSSVNVQAHCR